MPESFGARLRQRRQEQAIALATIAEQTKIKPSLLEALEHDDVSHWPSGIFRRAFIRAYAQAIGLDPDDVVREFLELYPDPHDVVADAASALNAEAASAAGGPQTRFRYLVGSAFSRLRRGSTVEVTTATGAPVTAAPLHPLGDLPPVPARSPESAAPQQPSIQQGPIESPSEDSSADAIAEQGVAPAAAVDFEALGDLCTAFARVDTAEGLQALLERSANILGATGIVVWVWDGPDGELKPAIAHGYSDRVLAQLPTVRRDADNPTAAVFRSAQACAIDGRPHQNGALVVPLMAPEGCVGVLAIELPHGSEQTRSSRVPATIIAAQLSVLIGDRQSAEAVPPETDAPPAEDFATPMLLAHGRR